jgi:hypothetical protein
MSEVRTVAPVCFRQRGEDDADASLPNDEHGVVGLEREQLDGLEAGVDGLDESRLLEGNVVGDFDESGGSCSVADDPVHDADVLGKAAAGRFTYACRCADLLVGFALRESLLAAVEANTTGDVMERHHALADGKAFDTFADGSDRSGHLMAEDARSRMRAAVDLLQVCSADAAGVEANQHLTLTNCGD